MEILRQFHTHVFWSEVEINLFYEGIKKFGKKWKKISQYIGTKSANAVRSQASYRNLNNRESYFWKAEDKEKLWTWFDG